MNTDKLKRHVKDWVSRLGSQSRVAEKCGISPTALSQWLSGKYGAETESLTKTIVRGLGYRESDWRIATSITNFKKIEFVFSSCRQHGLWMAVSNKAGSGKTQTLNYLFDSDVSGNVIYLQAEEWSARQFVVALAEKTCGVPKRGYTDISALIRMISDYVNTLSRPVLIIDEADKLKPSAFRRLIPLYNQTEHHLGCLLAGTDNLKKEIQRGVRCSLKGYDEMDSRLGRSYIELPGATEKEVSEICRLNGLNEEQSAVVWNEVEKVKKTAKVKTSKGITEKPVFFCEDLRRLMRLVRREQIANNIID
jgi:DNA transposition AAA+ family ATPase